MRSVASLAVILVLLAGCASQPAPAALPTSAAAASDLPANATLVTVHLGYDLTVTQGMVVTQRTGTTGNCLAWPGPFKVVHGNATATWSPQTPLAASLEVAAVDSAHHVRNAATGGSPRTVSMDGLAPGSNDFAVLQVQVPAPIGATVQQTVHVDVTFTAWAAAAPQPQVSACAV